MEIRKEITTTESKIVYQNRWMRVREDKIIRENGSDGIYGVVEKKDFATIVPIINSKMILVEQYRYPIAARYWEFPQGSWEDMEITPENLARAELKEETGYIANKIEKIGHLYVACGYSNQGYSIFVARELVQTQTNLDPEEVGLVAKEFDITSVEHMILENKIKDAATVAAFGLLKMRGIIS